MDSVHLIIGLGNPGAKYARTRHNIGFLSVEALAARWAASWREERTFEARLAGASVGGQRVLLCEPLTFMNASGAAVRAVADFHRVPVERLLVLMDDADLPLGEIRLRPSGGTGGHHGLESVEQYLGTREYARLRLGIGRGPGLREITGHVLGRFGSEEKPLLEAVLQRAANQVVCWLQAGVQKAMNDFNGRVDLPETKGTSQ
ncbi:MAG: aminoacyl-tRNA hydrolase [Verrucomicrobia bacterium]|jgi:PTH1 family peptidyl-tRNA hydrolase|nr:aminoacyl-tRNA hydrolase [Verrucomicrobiota bacterium]